ncbi:MAG: DUF3854 domain-containing protein, partial [Gemmatimonadetes bacterium]|nr:DUF3854 domain-containing protein [Gemmatimonadota bacterium]
MTALADWESVALNERRVYIVFDSDVMEKSAVYGALARLKLLLEARRATVLVVYLPAGDGAAKTGLDDYIAAGHSVDDLLSYAAPELRRPPQDARASPYSANGRGIVWNKPTSDGSVPVPLANFDARITADIIADDGVEATRTFQMEATLKGQTARFNVPASRFAAMSWPVENL